MVLVVCPLGKEYPVSGTMPLIGLGDWISVLAALTMRVIPAMAASSRTAYF